MSTERIINPEVVEPAIAPTSLHLFRFRPVEILPVLKRFDATLAFQTEFNIASGAYEKFLDGIQARKDKLTETKREMNGYLAQRMHTAASGAAYIAFNDKFSDSLTAEQIMDVFLVSLKINNLDSQASIDLWHNSREKWRASIVMERNVDRLKKYFDREVTSKPDWFQGDLDKWKVFIRQNCWFPGLITPKFNSKTVSYNDPEFQDSLGNTTEYDTPEWLEEGGTPDMGQVKAELKEDTAEIERIRDQTAQISRQLDNFDVLVADKYKRAFMRIERRRRETYPRIDNFLDFVLFAGTTKNLTAHFGDLEKLANLSPDELDMIAIKPDKLFDKTLSEFTESGQSISSRHILALWIERKLIEGKMISNTQDPLTEKEIQILEDLFEKPENDSLQKYRQTDNALFQVLHYGIRPLLGMLDQDESAYLAALVQEIKGRPIEGIIWEIAELISLRAGSEWKASANHDLTRLTAQIKEFSTKWLRNNSSWAYKELQRSLGEPLFSQELEVERKGVPDVLPDSAPIEISEMDEVSETINQGNLAGWQVLYTDNPRSIDDKYLHQINGESIDEREADLQHFVRSQSISCSIDPAKIIRMFDALLSTRDSVEEWTRMRIKVGDVEFKKLRPDRVRIFYVLNPDNKKIIFYIYQKKGWSYRL